MSTRFSLGGLSNWKRGFEFLPFALDVYGALGASAPYTCGTPQVGQVNDFRNVHAA
jgi:hypothetical protein